MKKIIFAALCINMCLHTYTMLAPNNDQNLWISKKLLWTFLPPAKFHGLGDTYEMKTRNIHVTHPETGETIFKTTGAQFILDMHNALFPDVAGFIATFCKCKKQEQRDLHLIRKVYMHSYALYKKFPRDSLDGLYTRPSAYCLPERIKGNCVHFKGNTDVGYFLFVQIIPSDGSKWQYDSRHKFGGLGLRPCHIDDKIGFEAPQTHKNGKRTYKDYQKRYSESLERNWFESKLGFLAQDAQKDIHVFCSDLNVNRMETFLNSMPKLSLYEHIIARDLLKHHSNREQ